MRTIVAAVALLGGLAACGSGGGTSGSPNEEVANFIGSEWTGTDTTMGNCNGSRSPIPVPAHGITCLNPTGPVGSSTRRVTDAPSGSM